MFSQNLTLQEASETVAPGIINRLDWKLVITWGVSGWLIG